MWQRYLSRRDRSHQAQNHLHRIHPGHPASPSASPQDRRHAALRADQRRGMDARGGVNLGEGPRAYERAIPTESVSTACIAGCVPGVHSRVRLSWAIAEG